MKLDILHTADLHHQEGPLLEDIIRCNGKIIEVAEERKPDLAVVPGDIFERRYSWDSPASMAALNFFYELGQICPVITVRGTQSHDVGEDVLLPFTKLSTKHQIYATTKIEQVSFDGQHFKPLRIGDQVPEEVLISCLPSPSKAHLMAIMETKEIRDGDLYAADLLKDVLEDWGIYNRELAKLGIPSLLLAHCSVLGAMTAAGQLIGKDIELSVDAIRKASATLTCMGHIHKKQDWGDIFYSGSHTRLNHGEPEEKGFFIHSIEDAKLVGSEFILTPATPMITVEIKEGFGPKECVNIWIKEHSVTGANVRVRYTVKDTELHIVDEDAIEKILTGQGAKTVKFERTIQTVERSRCEGISEIKDLCGKIKVWADTSEEELLPGTLNKAKMVESMGFDEIIKSYGDKLEQ